MSMSDEFAIIESAQLRQWASDLHREVTARRIAAPLPDVEVDADEFDEDTTVVWTFG